MKNVLFRADERRAFPWKSLVVAVACSVVLVTAPLRGQDDNGAAPPPPDNGAPAPDDATGAPDSSASFQTFYDSLGSQGAWIQSSDYGYVWQPDVNDPDWAPYTAGHWVYTDDGWTWVSDEPWGWATYHYGRWVNLDGTGWCWVPGYTWAPAWVSWRYGDGYCGWAPLPPDSFVGIDYYGDDFAIGVGFHIGGDCDGFYGIGAGWYNFLPVEYLGHRHYHGHYHDRGDNFAIINHTTNVTNINVATNGATSGGATTGGFHRVTTGGPMLAQVNSVSQTPVEKVSLVRTNQPGGGGALTANSLALYAPHVNPGTTTQPSRVAGSIGQATINHGVDIMRPLAVNSRLAPAPATEAQVQQARIAQNHAPAGAKVVTDNASVTPVLQAPLTSLKPMAKQVMTSPIPGTSPSTISNTVHVPSASGIAPTVRTYPGQGGGVPSRIYQPGTVYPPSSYQPHSSATGTSGGGSESRTYVRPEAPASSSSGASGTHQSTGGGSGGGGGSSRGGGGSGGNNQQQGH
jgi:uncharacterized membrane protein YgcG